MGRQLIIRLFQTVVSLLGMSLLCPASANFTRANCERLALAVQEYEDIGPVIEDLIARVRRYQATSK